MPSWLAWTLFLGAVSANIVLDLLYIRSLRRRLERVERIANDAVFAEAARRWRVETERRLNLDVGGE